MNQLLFPASLASLVICAAGLAQARDGCPANQGALAAALRAAVAPSGGETNGGLDNNEWAALVARDGTVCALAFSGATFNDQWPASRAIAAEKAFTANGLSLDGFALSTANLYAGAQPGGSLFGVVESHPPEPDLLDVGDPADFGTERDPLIGRVLGGVIVFGGGLALYDHGAVVGGLGVSGDSSCADHNVAWRVRGSLGLGTVPGGVSPQGDDRIVYDLRADDTSDSGYGHPFCGGREADVGERIGAAYIPVWAKAGQ